MRNTLLVTLSLILMVMSQAWAQTRTVSGKVTDAANGQGLPGVTVLVKGTQVGTATNLDGEYSLNVPAGAKTLAFRFVGYATVEKAVGNASTINVTMNVDAAKLSEVVVVGYGEQSRQVSTQTVATVSSKAFENMPVTSPQQLLQGQAAGVQVTSASGVLGASTQIRIRGAASITGGGQPLFVVDGVPLNDNAYSTNQGGGAPLNPLLNINSNDIESMTVLKDAAAVSIYGSRGSNGVVLIKTKSGALNKKTQVSLDYFTGFSEPTGILSYMSGPEWTSFVNASRVARGLTPTTFPTESFDWVKGVLQTGKNTSYNLSARGGDSKTRFFVAGNYNDEEGYTIGNDLRRLSGRINLDHNISDYVKVGVNYNLSRAHSNRINTENSTHAPLTGAYLQRPTVLPRDAEGQLVNTGFIANPFILTELNTNKFTMYRNTGNAFLEVAFLKNFTAKTDFGIDNVQSDSRSRQVNLQTPGGSAFRLGIQDYKWLSTNTLNYKNEFNDHSVGGLLGYSFETSRFDDITVAGTGFASDALPNVGSASTKTTTDATGSEWALESQFARLNYGFRNKYLVEGTIRRDGSSRFGPNKKYGVFYAGSAGWVLSEEEFVQNISAINFLKLTTSYGTSGNDRIGNYNYLELFGGGAAADYNGNSGLIPTTVPNPDLGWEQTAQFDVSLNATVFNFLDLEASYYAKNTTDLLANQPYPYTTGFTLATRNIGSMKNTGVDFQITSRNFSKGDFQWTTSLNMGFLKNRVTSLPTNKDAFGNDFLVGSAAQRAVVGKSLNEFFLVRYKGVNPESGHAEWFDKDGNVTTTYSSNDAVYVGSAIPKFTGGFTNNLAYKGFDLNAFFNFAYGSKIMIDGLRFTENINTPSFNKSTDLLNYWKNPGDKAFAPALSSPTAANFNQRSTLQLQNGSYLRLKTLSLGYTLPTALLAKTKAISSLRVYALGQNLYTLTAKDFRGPDPEVSANGASNQIVGESFFAMPQAKTVTFGVNIGF